MNESMTQGAVLFSLGMFVVEKVYSMLSNKNKLLAENTLALTKLTIKMEYLEKKLDEVGEIRRDVDKLGAKVRDMAT